MKSNYLTLTAILAGLALPVLPTPVSADEHDEKKETMPKELPVLKATLTPTEGNELSGMVKFEPVTGGKVKVTAMVMGLEPNAVHAIHIHQYGDATAADGTSAGGHFNPEGHEHGLPEKEMRHAGDLGNLTADEDGTAVYTITVENLSLNGHENGIIGRSVIVHEGEDQGTQPTGDAGARIAQGIIGIANPETQPQPATADSDAAQSESSETKLAGTPKESSEFDRNLDEAITRTEVSVLEAAKELGEAIEEASENLEDTKQ